MSSLYSAEMLRLALTLAQVPPLAEPDCRHEARAQPCGSRIALSLRCDAQARVTAIGIDMQACAVGQASAAVLAQSIIGKDRSDIAAALAGIERWLADPEARRPDWPGFAALDPARSYPARAGALRLPFAAALAALDQRQAAA